jgi:hypothetical protein
MAEGSGEEGGTHKDRETLFCVLRSGIPHFVSPALYHMIFMNWNSEWARPGMTRGQRVPDRRADHVDTLSTFPSAKYDTETGRYDSDSPFPDSLLRVWWRDGRED